MINKSTGSYWWLIYLSAEETLKRSFKVFLDPETQLQSIPTLAVEYNSNSAIRDKAGAGNNEWTLPP